MVSSLYTIIDCRLGHSSSASRELREAAQKWVGVVLDDVTKKLSSSASIEFGLLLVRSRWVEEVLPWGHHQPAFVIQKLVRLRDKWVHDGSVEKEPARAPPGAGGGDGLLRALHKATLGLAGSSKVGSSGASFWHGRLEIWTFHAQDAVKYLAKQEVNAQDVLKYLANQEVAQSSKRFVKRGGHIVVVDLSGDKVGDAVPEGVTVTSVPTVPANAVEQNSAAEISEVTLDELLTKTIKFVMASSALDSGSIVQVRQIAKLLKERPALSIDLVGYTGIPGGQWSTQEKCIQLSQLRCKTVQEYLQKEGVQNRISLKGAGVDTLKGPCVGISISQKHLPAEQHQVAVDVQQCTGVERKDFGVSRAVGNWLKKTTAPKATHTMKFAGLEALDKFVDTEARQKYFMKNRILPRRI